MQRRTFVLTIATMLAGARSLVRLAAEQDVVTGKWGSDGVPYLELKLEAGTRISGTTYWREDGQLVATAPIGTGRFEPDSRAVTLDGTVQHPDAGKVPFHIEGRIDKDIISGTFRLGDNGGGFSFRRL